MFERTGGNEPIVYFVRASDPPHRHAIAERNIESSAISPLIRPEHAFF
jgi:hypothetical protein